MARTFHALGAPLADTLNGRTLLHHAAACDAVQVLAWLCDEKTAELPINMLDTKVGRRRDDHCPDTTTSVDCPDTPPRRDPTRCSRLQ